MKSTHSRQNWRLLVVAAVAALSAMSVALFIPGNARASRAATTMVTPQFADIIEAAAPAVVSINVRKAVASRHAAGYGGPPPDMDQFFRRFFGPLPPMRGSQRPVMALGSGFVIDESGYIVTNNHVIEDAEEVTVVFSDDQEYPATLVGRDPKTDLALLKIDAEDLPAISFADSEAARVGDWVVAIGNPFGLGNTATVGIISARGRDIQSGPYDNYLQIDAPINRGNSGGPVLNLDGQVIGVNTAIFSPNGGNVGIGFAIPSDQVQQVIEQLRAKGMVDRGWLGIQLQGLDKKLAASMGLESDNGALVADVVADSPADDAGLRIGDVVVDFNGHDVASPRELSLLVGSTDSGERVKVGVMRSGEKKTLKVKLGRAEEPMTIAAAADGEHGDIGLSLAPLDDQMRARLNLDRAADGVAVTWVAPGSIADKNGLRPGDVIVRVGSQRVESPQDVQEAIAAARSDDRDSVVLLIRRGDYQQFRTLGLA